MEECETSTNDSMMNISEITEHLNSKYPGTGPGVSCAETRSEDFIIVENPEFSQLPKPGFLSDIIHTTGVENDVLPPPRTLDDSPVRKRGRKKGISNVPKAKRQKSVNSSKDKSSKNLTTSSKVMLNQNTVEQENGTKSSSVPFESNSSEMISNLDQDVEIVEVNRSASYGLRRKFQIKDFSYDHDSSDNEEDGLCKPHVCSECGVCLETKRALQHHQITYHDHHTCDLCGSDFTTKIGLKRHIQIKHAQIESEQDKSYMCLECDFIGETETELTQHHKSEHNKGEGHVCDVCGKDYATLLGLQKHVSLQHSEMECPLCNQVFKLSKALRDHMKLCESASVTSEFLSLRTLKPKIFPCQICGKRFSERGNRARHLKIHQGILDYTCNYCGKKCSEKQALQSHIRHIHTGERPHHCDTCPRTFVTISDLRRHQHTVHTDLRRFSCPDCGKAFKTRDALKHHMKLKTGEKSWQCGVCSKKFATKGGLKTHMVVHSDIKMYECETCQRQFTHKASLEAHVRVHTGLMPYVCPECGKKFAHLPNRNRHVRTMHGGSVVQEVG